MTYARILIVDKLIEYLRKDLVALYIKAKAS